MNAEFGRGWSDRYIQNVYMATKEWLVNHPEQSAVVTQMREINVRAREEYERRQRAEVLKQHVEQCPEHPMSKLRAQLLRDRQGLLNILEVRKLDSDKWGQRDGYGGRYGALTREEIEGVIEDIDAALK